MRKEWRIVSCGIFNVYILRLLNHLMEEIFRFENLPILAVLLTFLFFDGLSPFS